MSAVGPTSPPASQRAYELVKGRWLDGSLRDNALLSEGEVAGELGISRTPVREAFLRLEAEGLLELYPKRGALVLPISDRDGRELLEARLLVERHCLAALLAGGDGGGRERRAALVDELRGHVAEQRAALERADVGAYAAADRRMHRAWVAAAGNRVLLGLYDQLRDRQQRLTAQLLQHRRRDPQRMIAEHEDLVAALEAGEGERLDGLLVAHVEGAGAALLA